MPEHLSTDEIEGYLDRRLAPAALLAADDHLAGCEPCRRRAKDSQNKARAAGLPPLPLEEASHLRYEELENYADEKIDAIEREIADVHLQICRDCRAELDGLIEMRKLIEADLAARDLRQTKTEKAGFFRWPDFFARGNFLKLGFAAAVLMIFALAMFLFSGRGPNAPEIVRRTPANLDAPPDAAPRENSVVNVHENAPSPNANTNLPAASPDEKRDEDFPDRYRAPIERALAASRLDFPAEFDRLGAPRPGVLMSGGGASVPFALEAPLGKIVESDRPQFAWRALEGAESYVVRVYDENFKEVAASRPLAGTRWQADRPLARNKIYIWQVTAVKDGQEIKSPVRPAPDARFKIADAARAAELARLGRRFRGRHLELGILYAEAGLLERAAREFQKEIAKNPASKQARKFLRDVRRRR